MREVYLYQTVHILDGESLCLREHLAVLDRWSRTLFGCPGPQDAREVGTAIAAVAGREAPGSDRSKFVRLVLPASGSIRGRRVYAPPGEASIGRSLAVRSIRAAGLELIEAPVGRDELPRMDELFFIDHRGVTALSRCDGQPYMAILAERIAGALRGLFPNM